MKAKEYAKMIQEEMDIHPEDFDAVVDTIMKKFLNEWLEVGKQRRVQKARAVVAWFKEGHQKWEAVVERVEGTQKVCLNPMGFYICVKTAWPEIWEMFIECCYFTGTKVPDIS